MTVFQSYPCVDIADPNSVQNVCRNDPSKYDVASYESPRTPVVRASDLIPVRDPWLHAFDIMIVTSSSFCPCFCKGVQ